MTSTTSCRGYFYPRPPRGGRPESVDATVEAIKFLSTPSARRATGPAPDFRRMTVISIHALREEGDTQRADLSDLSDEISIHALREEGDIEQ